jgi:hypothetical protein
MKKSYLYNKKMLDLIDKFTTTVTKSGSTITLTYTNGPLSGWCEYNQVRVSNRLRQEVLILTQSEMGDIIEYLNSNGGISKDDLTKVEMTLRDHNLKVITQDLDL